MDLNCQYNNKEYKCDICNAMFQNKSNLNRHKKKIHVQTKELQNSSVCSICNKTFLSCVAYETHLLKEHDSEIEKKLYRFNSINEFIAFKNANATHKFVKKCGTKKRNNVDVDYYYCNQNKNLSINKYKRCPAMMTVIHGKDISVEITDTQTCVLNIESDKIVDIELDGECSNSTNIGSINVPSTQTFQSDKNCKITCGICKIDLVSKKGYEEHLNKIHDIIIQKENLIFQTQLEFLDWKKNIEQECTSDYVKHSGTNIVKNKIYEYFYCHRSGYFYGRGNNKRSNKILGTNKINGTCPSMIAVTISENSTIKVEFTKTHVGHTSDLGRVRLNDEERMKIAIDLSNKKPISEILNDIRDSVGDKLSRVHLLDRRGVLNIKNKFFPHEQGVLDTNDAQSVHAWAKSIENSESLIRYYKPQGLESNNCLKNEDFLLVIMNNAQRDMLKLYGNDVVCVDFTHGINNYNFDLCILCVLDDKREGFPAALILSNRQDSQALEVAFQSLKCSGVNICPYVFMSDDTDSFHNAWCSVFGPPKKRLLCTWHIDRSWRRKLTEYIKNETLQADSYKVLRSLLEERDEQTFQILLPEVINLFKNNNDTIQFAKYFETYYSKRCEQWAYCYRKWAGINTNMHLERMHRTIKYIYLEGKKVKRLDKSLHALMQFIKDQSFQRLVAIHKGKISGKMSNIRKRHQESMKLDVTKVSVHMQDSWYVQSFTTMGEIYEVRLKKQCNLQMCPLQCTFCQECLHNMVCTCIDNAIQWNMCKHIHLVCRLINAEKQISQPVSPDSQPELLINECDENRSQELESHVNQVSNELCANSLLAVKTKGLNLLAQLQKDLLQCTNPGDCMKLVTILKGAQASFLGVNENSKLLTKFQSNKQSPSNKKIIKQRFYSTKRKQANKIVKKYRKPSSKEANSIACNLLIKGKSSNSEV